MPRNRLYRIRKTHSCNYDPAGPHILGNTIGNAIAGGIEGGQDTSAQGQGGGGGSSFSGPISNMGNFSLPGGIAFDLVPPETQIQAAVDGGVISSDQGASALAAVEQIKSNLRASYVASQGVASGYSDLPNGGTYYIDHATLDASQADDNSFLVSHPGSSDISAANAAYAHNSALIDKWDGIAGAQVNTLFGGFLGVTAGGALLGSLAPAGLSFLGYEAGTMSQAVALKAGIGAAIEFTGNAITHSDNTVGGYTGAVVASTLIGPGVANYLGIGAKGLLTAGAASGFGSNLIGQSIDLAIGSATDFSPGKLALSTLGGIAGAGLAIPALNYAAPSSLLLSKWAPYIEETFFAPVTASGAAGDTTQKAIVNQLVAHKIPGF